MRKITDKLKRKHEGSLYDILPSVVIMLGVAIMVFAFLGIFNVISRNEEVKQVVRGSMLLVETKGYLDGSDIADITSDLTALGVTNITISVKDASGRSLNSSSNVAGYGEAIFFDLYCTIPAESLNQAGQDLFSLTFQNTGYDLHISRKTISKC